MKHGLFLATLVANGVLAPEALELRARHRSPAIKNCLRCGAEHEHNNSFCSPDCCKKYKVGAGDAKLRP